MPKMNDYRGVSTTQKRNQEQFESYEWKGKKYVMYDYRAMDGELFSTVLPTLELCRQVRDEWLDKKEAANVN